MSYHTSILGSSYSASPSGIYGSYRKKTYLLPSSSSDSYSSESSSRNLYETRRYLSDSFGLRSGPSHDKYGKPLSNYERWKLQNGESLPSRYNRDSEDSKKKNNRRTLLGWEDDYLSTPSYLPSSSSLSERQSIYGASKEDDWKKNSGRESRGILGWTPEATDYRSSRSVTLGPSSNNYLQSTSGGFSEDTTTRQPTSSRAGSRLGDKSSRLGSSSIRSNLTSFPSEVREKLSGYTVQDVRGDGGCYYRCLSLYFTGTESNYNNYRREVMSYIRDNLENYSSMIKSEIGYASTSDYFTRKTRMDRQEFAETTEIIATCVVYNINVHVLALVPGRLNRWEWLHFDPSIGSGRPSSAHKHIYLYNQGSVHFQLCSPKF